MNRLNLPDGHKYCGTKTDTLCILEVEKSDNKAHYRCSVKNEKGAKLSNEAILTVSKLVIIIFLTGLDLLCMKLN